MDSILMRIRRIKNLTCVKKKNGLRSSRVILEDGSGFKQYGRFSLFSGTVSGQSICGSGKT